MLWRLPIAPEKSFAPGGRREGAFFVEAHDFSQHGLPDAVFPVKLVHVFIAEDPPYQGVEHGFLEFDVRARLAVQCCGGGARGVQVACFEGFAELPETLRDVPVVFGEGLAEGGRQRLHPYGHPI